VQNKKELLMMLFEQCKGLFQAMNDNDKKELLQVSDDLDFQIALQEVCPGLLKAQSKMINCLFEDAELQSFIDKPPEFSKQYIQLHNKDNVTSVKDVFVLALYEAIRVENIESVNKVLKLAQLHLVGNLNILTDTSAMEYSPASLVIQFKNPEILELLRQYVNNNKERIDKVATSIDDIANIESALDQYDLSDTNEMLSIYDDFLSHIYNHKEIREYIGALVGINDYPNDSAIVTIAMGEY